MAPKKADDHWSFLEEIEAPMWVDLTLEIECTVQDVTEEWFNTTHLFHQCSSAKLKSGFSHHFEGKETLDIDLQGPCSPNLPSSVSRSRGKVYRGMKQGCNNPEWIFPKTHTLKDLGDKSPHQKPVSHKEIKLRETLTKPKGCKISRTGLNCESGDSLSSKEKFTSQRSVGGKFTSSTSTKTSARNSQSIVTFEGSQPQQQNALSGLDCESGDSHSSKAKFTSGSSESGNFTSSTSTKTSVRNSQSTVTVEGSQPQQQSALAISSQPFSNSSVLLSIVRRSLRKSCVTRQASRMEITNNTDQTRGYGSLSGKSSVSSSSVPGCEVNSASSVTAEVQEFTPDSRNGTRMGARTDKNRLKSSNNSKMPPPAFVQQGKSSSIRSSTTDSAAARAAKVKVQQSSSRKVLHPVNVKSRQVLTTSRKDMTTLKNSSSKFTLSSGKENGRGNMALAKSCTGKNSGTRGVNLGRREKKQVRSQTCDRRVLADSKDKLKAKVEGRTNKGATLEVYVR